MCIAILFFIANFKLVSSTYKILTASWRNANGCSTFGALFGNDHCDKLLGFLRCNSVVRLFIIYVLFCVDFSNTIMCWVHVGRYLCIVSNCHLHSLLLNYFIYAVKQLFYFTRKIWREFTFYCLCSSKMISTVFYFHCYDSIRVKEYYCYLYTWQIPELQIV